MLTNYHIAYDPTHRVRMYQSTPLPPFKKLSLSITIFATPLKYNIQIQSPTLDSSEKDYPKCAITPMQWHSQD